MKIDIDNLKKRIIYRSQYRGTREMDKLLYSFIKENINKIDESKLISLEKFLDNDDENLFKFYNDNVNDLKYKDDYILELFKNFKFKK